MKLTLGLIAIPLITIMALPLLLIPALAAALGPAPTAGPASGGAVADIPNTYLALYVRDGTLCPGLDWALLAAIGKIETDHGRSPLPGVNSGENYAGAAGPMQFLQPTFTSVVTRHPPPPGGARPPSRYDPSDAIHTAAAYLCDSGLATATATGDPVSSGLYRAVWTYNHSDAYVHNVLAQAATYRTATPAPTADTRVGVVAANTAGLRALAYARGQLGLPYQWGGDGPAAGDTGFDCSGLTTAAYAATGITLPRTAQTQYDAGPLLPAGTPLQPGDLLFFGTHTQVHHVGIATGDGMLMIHAPHQGATITITDGRTFPDLLAASRPTAATDLG